MFDIGFQELVIIFIVALLVFGPEKLPEAGRTLGKWIIEIRKGIHNAKSQIESEISEIDKKNEADMSGLHEKKESSNNKENNKNEIEDKA